MNNMEDYILYAGFTLSVFVVFLVAAYLAREYYMRKENKLILDQVMSICSARQRRYEEFACEKCELNNTPACSKKLISAFTETETTYHLSCTYCGYDWWDENPFPDTCPKCKRKRGEITSV